MSGPNALFVTLSAIVIFEQMLGESEIRAIVAVRPIATRSPLGSPAVATPSLKTETIKIRDLVADYRAGRIVIPEFQRDYVWRKSRAPWLMDSLYKHFPV